MATALRRLALHSRLYTTRSAPPRLQFHTSIAPREVRRLYRTTPIRRKDDEISIPPSIVEQQINVDELEAKLRKAFQNDDKPEILRLSGREEMSAAEFDELRDLLNKLQAAEAKQDLYEKLTDQLIDAPDGSEEASRIFVESGLAEADYKELPVNEAGETMTEEEIWETEKKIWDAIDPNTAPMITDEFDELLRKHGGNNRMAMREFVQNIQERKASGLPYESPYEEQLEEAFEPPRREAPGFWNDDGYDKDEKEDDDFDQDELPTKGHRWLDVQRDIRQWSRYAIWELPLLSRLQKPFVPADESKVLKFRYTTYFGEHHPAEAKVVVEFSPSAAALELSSEQRAKLIKLAGSRYNPSKDIIKMSCESFPEPAQNKRYLGELVEVLLKEAKDLTDDFSDIPFDFRHHRPKIVHEFPREWIMTESRKKELEASQVPKIEAPVVDGLLFVPGGKQQRAQEELQRDEIKSQDMLWKEKRTEMETIERDMLRTRIEHRLESIRVAASTEERGRGRRRKRDKYHIPRPAKLATGLEATNGS